MTTAEALLLCRSAEPSLGQARRSTGQVRWICIAHPSGEEPGESVFPPTVGAARASHWSEVESWWMLRRPPPLLVKANLESSEKPNLTFKEVFSDSFDTKMPSNPTQKKPKVMLLHYWTADASISKPLHAFSCLRLLFLFLYLWHFHLRCS